MTDNNVKFRIFESTYNFYKSKAQSIYYITFLYKEATSNEI